MNLDRTICLCNDITADEVVKFLKNSDINSIESLIDKMEIGNKCESCVESGYKDDGFSLTKILNLVKRGGF